MTESRRKRGRPFGKMIAVVIIVTIAGLIVTCIFPFLGGVYLKFFLVCIIGLAFIGISYLIRT